MQKLDSHSAVPLYQQLYNEIKRAVDTGVYKSGEQIPPEDKLREMYGISRITVRKALEKLTEDKILVKRHGKGTFVSQTEYVETSEAGGSFTKSCLLMNAVPSTRILRQEYQKADKNISEILQTKNEEILLIERLRCIDGVPVILERDYFTEEYDFLCKMELEDQSLLQIIREQGGRLVRNYQDMFDIRRADGEQARLLCCEKGYPLLRVRQRIYGTDARLIYYNEQYILSDHYKYAVTTVVS